MGGVINNSDERIREPVSLESKRDVIKRHVLFLMALLAIIGVEFAYRKPLFDASIRLQEELQGHLTNGGIIAFKGFSEWGAGPAYFGFFLYVFLQEQRGRAFYYAIFLTFTLFVMNLTKMAYHEPRPYMYSEAIQVFGCSAEYGNPSGHSIFAAAFDIFLYLDVFHAQEDRSSRGKRPVWWSYLQAASLFVAVTLALCVGFARFYVGVHTINQILYGWLWGLWIALYFHFCLRVALISHIVSIRRKTVVIERDDLEGVEAARRNNGSS
jgi:membrane-associated phospholipid phosphatase